MYGKVFQQIFDSSIAESHLVRLVFQDMLVLSDQDGILDMTPESLSRRTNVPLDVVRMAIAALESPDPESRTPDHDGRRIVRLDDHRSWGWQIVNKTFYRDLKDRDDERAKAAERKRRQRDRSRSMSRDVTPGHAPSRKVTRRPSRSLHTDTDTNEDTDKEKTSCPNSRPDVPFGEESRELKAARHLFGRIRENNPSAKAPNLQRWAKDFDRIFRIDERSEADVLEVLDWCQGDSFWLKNILSPAKLRKQFDQLTVGMQPPPPKVPSRVVQRAPRPGEGVDA